VARWGRFPARSARLGWGASGAPSARQQSRAHLEARSGQRSSRCLADALLQALVPTQARLVTWMKYGGAAAWAMLETLLCSVHGVQKEQERFLPPCVQIQRTRMMHDRPFQDADNLGVCRRTKRASPPGGGGAGRVRQRQAPRTWTGTTPTTALACLWACRTSLRATRCFPSPS